MHRIDTSTAQKDKFGAGKDGFTSGNPQTGVPATEVSAEILDAIQEEIAAVIEDSDSGATLDKSKNNQLVTAIKAIIRSIGMAASETVRGVLKVATQTQTNAGAADDVAVTPKKLRAGFVMVLAASGYIAFPTWMGGWIIQWVARTTGTMSAGSQEVANGTWTLAFPTAVVARWSTAIRTVTSGAAYANPDTQPNTPTVNFRTVTTCTIAGQFDVISFAIGY